MPIVCSHVSVIISLGVISIGTTRYVSRTAPRLHQKSHGSIIEEKWKQALFRPVIQLLSCSWCQICWWRQMVPLLTTRTFREPTTTTIRTSSSNCRTTKRSYLFWATCFSLMVGNVTKVTRQNCLSVVILRHPRVQTLSSNVLGNDMTL